VAARPALVVMARIRSPTLVDRVWLPRLSLVAATVALGALATSVAVAVAVSLVLLVLVLLLLVLLVVLVVLLLLLLLRLQPLPAPRRLQVAMSQVA
jgi:hypothetical protein